MQFLGLNFCLLPNGLATIWPADQCASEYKITQLPSTPVPHFLVTSKLVARHDKHTCVPVSMRAACVHRSKASNTAQSSTITSSYPVADRLEVTYPK